MDWLIVVAGAALLVFSLKKGYIGIYGAAIYREKNPLLYWFQFLLIAAAVLVVAIVVAIDYF